MQRRKIYFYLTLVLITHVALFVFKNNTQFVKEIDSLQQENFTAYVDSLRSGSFPEGLNFIDTRLFPGLPFSIFTVDLIINNSYASALLVLLLSLILTYLSCVYLTKNPFFSFWITIFPPIVYEQTSKISTESLLISLSLFSLALISKGKYYLVSLILSFASIVRLIALFIFLGFTFYLFRIGQKNNIFKYSLVFLIFALLLIAFNLKFFNEGILYQIKANSAIGNVNIGVLQVFKDIWEEFTKRNFRELFVGLFYVTFSLFIYIKTIFHKGDFMFKNDRSLILMTVTGMMFFVYLAGPSEFLTQVRRFLSVIFPLVFVANYKNLVSRRKLLGFSLLTLPLAFI